MFKRIFERIGIFPSHTELGEMGGVAYRRFALVDPFESASQVGWSLGD